MLLPVWLVLAALDPDAVTLYEHQKQPGKRVFALEGVPQPERFYRVDESLGDPRGFLFAASNTLGVFEIGDRVPLVSTTKLVAHLAGGHLLKIVCDGVTVAEAQADEVEFTAKGPASCIAQAWTREKPWVDSQPIVLTRPDANTLRLPSSQLDESVTAEKDIAYTEGKPEDARKHQLDIYRPKQQKGLAPVFFFVHGGSWRSGDRGQYPALGNRFAKQGAVVVVPSYRLAPANPHPAQIEDTAAAFAWTVRNIEKYGGDPRRIYVGGHSAGGHLVALLALDQRWLAAYELDPASSIRGVIAMSGVYVIESDHRAFGADSAGWRAASPATWVTKSAPPFIVTYCQWDYATLPAQARRFHQQLTAAGVKSELVYVPGENHISEIINATRQDDRTAQSVLRLIGLGTPSLNSANGGSK